jgi:hypothetical protein
MRNRIAALVVSLALILVFTPQAYALPEYSTYYTVYYSCICSPNCYGTLVGEWTHACNGQWYGWGWRPYENSCAQWVVTEEGEDCNPWD